jgi:hypothetical protein
MDKPRSVCLGGPFHVSADILPELLAGIVFRVICISQTTRQK